MPVSFVKLLSAAAVIGLASAMPAFGDPVSINTVLNGPFADATGDPADPAPGGSAFLFFDGNQPGTIQSVQSVTLNLSHTYVGDLQVLVRYLPNGFTISDPNAPYIDATLFDSINDGEFTYSNNLAGTYSFTSQPLSTLQAAVLSDDDDALIPAGTYAASDFYLTGDPAESVDLSAAFAGKTLADGDFYLIVFDYGVGDTGSLTSATLNLTTAVPEPGSIAALGLTGAALVRRRK